MDEKKARNEPAFDYEIVMPPYLTAVQVAEWMECEAPKSITIKAFRNAYEQLLLADKFVVNGKEITQANFEVSIAAADFPAAPIYQLVHETAALVQGATSKKKSDGA